MYIFLPAHPPTYLLIYLSYYHLSPSLPPSPSFTLYLCLHLFTTTPLPRSLPISSSPLLHSTCGGWRSPSQDVCVPDHCPFERHLRVVEPEMVLPTSQDRTTSDPYKLSHVELATVPPGGACSGGQRLSKTKKCKLTSKANRKEAIRCKCGEAAKLDQASDEQARRRRRRSTSALNIENRNNIDNLKGSCTNWQVSEE